MNSKHGFFPSIRHPGTAGLPPKAGAIGRRTPRENWRYGVRQQDQINRGRGAADAKKAGPRINGPACPSRNAQDRVSIANNQ
ncbi:hypothetical protein [Azospirillum palustre]